MSIEKINAILEEFNLSPKSFCLAPYLHLDFDQSGEMHSCYEGKRSLGNWKTKSIFSEFNSKQYQDLRNQHRQGDTDNSWHNCENCYRHEGHNVQSHRLRNLKDKYKELGHNKFRFLIEKISQTDVANVNPDKFDFVEMRLSNFCNLRCMHCDHRSSTQWLNFFTDKENFDEAKRVGVPIHPDANPDNMMKFFSDHQISDSIYFDDIVSVMQNSKLITFSGGEPLMDPNYIPLMDKVVRADCSNIQFDIHTNLNVKNIEKYFRHWEKMRETSIYISIDVPPSTYPYFRRLGDWELVKSNIFKIKKHFPERMMRVIGHVTFGMFGALRYKEIADVWQELGLEFNASLITRGPTSARYLPNKLKDKCIAEMEKILSLRDLYDINFLTDTEKCLTYLTNTEKYEDLHHDVVNWCRLHDKKTDLQTLDFYPELEMYYNNNNEK